jgi:hypothetical protein
MPLALPPKLELEVGYQPPVYIRLPTWGVRDPYFGLTRTALDQLTRAQPFNNFRPPVKSKILKMAGAKSGIKLIDFASLKAYLDALPDASRDKREDKPEAE